MFLKQEPDYTFQDWKTDLFVALPVFKHSNKCRLLDGVHFTTAFLKITGIDMRRTNKSFVKKEEQRETAREIKIRNCLKRMN